MRRCTAYLIFACGLTAAGCSTTTTIGPASVAQSAPSAPAAKAAAQAAAVDAETPPEKDPNKLHCTRYKPTGSHRSVTRCVTQAQRQREQDAARLTLESSTGPTMQSPDVVVPTGP